MHRILLLALQGVYILYSSRSRESLNRITPVLDLHFAIHNVLHISLMALIDQSKFWLAELALVADLFNLLVAYFHRPRDTWLAHIGVISGPLSWVSIAIFWNGSLMIPGPQRESLAAAIVGSIFIWVILAEGSFFCFKYMVSIIFLVFLCVCLNVSLTHWPLRRTTR